MEFVVSNKNYEELNKIRISFIETYLNTKVEYSSYKKIGTDTQLITINIDEDLTVEEKQHVMKLIEKIDYHSKFLYKGYGLPIKQLKSMNSKYHKILNYKDVYYYTPDSFTIELEEFAHKFIKMFDYNYREVSLSSNVIKHTILLESLALLPCKIHNKNGRLYLEIDGETHHMDYDLMCSKLFKDMENSNLEPCYKIDNNMDKVNILRVMKGKSPLSPYYPNQSTSYHTFKLTMAFAKLCKKENLPMLNSKDIVLFSQDVLGFEYYTVNNLIKLKEMYETLEINEFKEHEFDYLENALAFSIYLSGFGIKNFILSNKDLHKYTVCYIYSTLLDPHVNIDDMKHRMLDYYLDVHQTDRDHLADKKFKHMSIQELLSCVLVGNNLIFDKHNVQHINPYDNSPLPISYYEVKGYKKYSVYNIGNIIKGIFKRPPVYDRSELEVRDVEIVIENGDIIIHGVTVAKDMFFTDTKRALRHICKIWKKGYFMNSLGMIYYLESGDFMKECIKSPEWFTFKKSSESNFYKFLKFNDL